MKYRCHLARGCDLKYYPYPHFTGEKLPDSSGESNQIHHSFTEAEWIMTILKQSDLLEKKNIPED